MKGPAAATLYGIQASNGVVRVTTKRGVAGPPRWNLYTEVGAGQRPQHLSAQLLRPRYDRHRHRRWYDGFCTIQSELDGFCTQTSVDQFSAAERAGLPVPYKAGLRQQYGASVSGGSEQVTYYVSGEYENEVGPFRLPQAEYDSVPGARGERAGQPASGPMRWRRSTCAPTSAPTSRKTST